MPSALLRVLTRDTAALSQMKLRSTFLSKTNSRTILTNDSSFGRTRPLQVLFINQHIHSLHVGLYQHSTVHTIKHFSDYQRELLFRISVFVVKQSLIQLKKSPKSIFVKISFEHEFISQNRDSLWSCVCSSAIKNYREESSLDFTCGQNFD